MGVGPAAQHFGEAVCGAGNEPCASEVARGWERSVLDRFGATAGPPSAMGPTMALQTACALLAGAYSRPGGNAERCDLPGGGYVAADGLGAISAGGNR